MCVYRIDLSPKGKVRPNHLLSARSSLFALLGWCFSFWRYSLLFPWIERDQNDLKQRLPDFWIPQLVGHSIPCSHTHTKKRPIWSSSDPTFTRKRSVLSPPPTQDFTRAIATWSSGAGLCAANPPKLSLIARNKKCTGQNKKGIILPTTSNMTFAMYAPGTKMWLLYKSPWLILYFLGILCLYCETHAIKIPKLGSKLFPSVQSWKEMLLVHFIKLAACTGGVLFSPFHIECQSCCCGIL